MSTVRSATPWALVLAGGDGTRLQQFTRELTGAPIPKQYCRLLGERSLLEATLDRVRPLAPSARTVVVVTRAHRRFSREQLHALPPANVVVQPSNRDTGPGIIFALRHLASRRPHATVAMLPSDHYIDDDRAFVAYLERAVRLVDRFPDKIVLLGIRPDHAESGYGYIMPSRPVVGGIAGAPAHHVARFHEKPTRGLAAQLGADGGLWNSFVMVFRVLRMIELIQYVAPTEFAQMAALPDDPIALAAAYETVVPWNFSQRVLARIPGHLLVLPVDDLHWSDWGTPDLIEHTLRTLKQAPPWRAAKHTVTEAA